MNEENFLKGIDGIHKICRDIAQKKNHDYGDNNLTVFGVKGNLVRASDKLARLKTLIWDKVDQEVVDEKVLDTVYDLVNYATYLAMMLSGKWE